MLVCDTHDQPLDPNLYEASNVSLGYRNRTSRTRCAARSTAERALARKLKKTAKGRVVRLHILKRQTTFKALEMVALVGVKVAKKVLYISPIFLASAVNVS
jgi:hypothetical protein